MGKIPHHGDAVQPELKKSLGGGVLTFFGLGNILGAGIYVLVGKVAHVSGGYTLISFITAALAGLLMALVYGELSSRYPYASSETTYINEGLHIRWLASASGVAITLAGIVSAGAIIVGFSGYLGRLVNLPGWLLIVIGLLMIIIPAMLGIEVSAWASVVITLFEISGLLLVITSWFFRTEPGVEVSLFELPHNSLDWLIVFQGAFLAFYAYIGFEDMVKMAEETRNARRVMPLAILGAFLVSTVLYILTAAVCLKSASTTELGNSNAPLLTVYQANNGPWPSLLTLISMFAVINGALFQLVMASRMLYGMARRGWLPRFLAGVSPKRRIPVWSTWLSAGLIAVFAFLLPVQTLADSTSFLILVVFCIASFALLQLKRHSPGPSYLNLPAPVVLAAFIVSALLVVMRLVSLIQ